MIVTYQRPYFTITSMPKKIKIDPNVETKIEPLGEKIFTTKKLANPDFDDSAIEHPEDNTKMPSPDYVKYLKYKALYLKYKALYDDAEDKLTDLQKRVDGGEAEAMTEMSINGKSYIRRRDEALKRWETIGYKGKIEKAMNYNDAIESIKKTTPEK